MSRVRTAADRSIPTPPNRKAHTVTSLIPPDDDPQAEALDAAAAYAAAAAIYANVAAAYASAAAAYVGAAAVYADPEDATGAAEAYKRTADAAYAARAARANVPR